MEYKFRAWAERTVDNQFDYAWNKSKEKFDPIEPSNLSLLWDKWYKTRDMYFHYLQRKWDKENPVEERYTKIKEMITDIKVNGTVTRPYGYEILALMQFAGLQDKKGKEIYEGDICIVSLSYFNIKDEKATVVFHNGAFQFQYGCEKFFSKPYGAWDDVEVIGNIYENPKLLEIE